MNTSLVNAQMVGTLVGVMHVSLSQNELEPKHWNGITEPAPPNQRPRPNEGDFSNPKKGDPYENGDESPPPPSNDDYGDEQSRQGKSFLKRFSV